MKAQHRTAILACLRQHFIRSYDRYNQPLAVVNRMEEGKIHPYIAGMAYMYTYISKSLRVVLKYKNTFFIDTRLEKDKIWFKLNLCTLCCFND